MLVLPLQTRAQLCGSRRAARVPGRQDTRACHRRRRRIVRVVEYIEEVDVETENEPLF